MKKLFYLCFILLTGSLSCRPICACEPVIADLYMVISSSAGDLLNPNTQGYYPKDEIKLVLREKNGTEHPINFNISLPISYEKLKVDNYQLKVDNAITLIQKDFDLYLTLPNKPPMLLKLTLRKDGRKIETLTVDGLSLKREDKLPFNTLFYFTL